MNENKYSSTQIITSKKVNHINGRNSVPMQYPIELNS